MPNIYNAPAPTYKNRNWTWFAVRIVCPPILLWDITKMVGNKWLGETIGKLILPAQNANFSHLAINDNDVTNYNENNLICKKHEVITHDGAHLDTLEITHKSQRKLDPDKQLYIINFVGNADCYENNIDTMKDDAEALKANVIGFNFRGVGQSTGKPKSKNDLLIDGIAQVQILLKRGVLPQNIYLKGQSLGGALSAGVAAYFHRKGQPINTFNSRSFSTISNYLTGHIQLKSKIFAQLAKPFVKFGLALVGWEINAGKDILDVDARNREYIVVRPSKKLRKEQYPGDQVIPYPASLHEALTTERRAKKAEIDKKIDDLNNILKTEPLRKNQLIQTRHALVEDRKKLKDNKMYTIEKDVMDAHNISLSSLRNRSGKDGQTFFREFVLRPKAQSDIQHQAGVSLYTV